MRVRAKFFGALALCAGLGCSSSSGVPAGAAGSTAGATVAGSPSAGGAGAGAAGAKAAGAGGAALSAGMGGMSANGMAGSSGSSVLGSDVCARAPVDSCDLLSMCESVKAQKNCSGKVEFVACAARERTCPTEGQYCAKDMDGVEWFFPTSCGKAQIQAPHWTLETKCSCASDADAGT